MLAVIAWQAWGFCGLGATSCRRAAARAHRGAVLHYRGAAGHAPGDRRDDDFLALARRLVHAQTRAIIANSLDVAHAYVDEHGQVIRTDIVNMARDIDAASRP